MNTLKLLLVYSQSLLCNSFPSSLKTNAEGLSQISITSSSWYQEIHTSQPYNYQYTPHDSLPALAAATSVLLPTSVLRLTPPAMLQQIPSPPRSTRAWILICTIRHHAIHNHWSFWSLSCTADPRGKFANEEYFEEFGDEISVFCQHFSFIISDDMREG
jgi:hypothetical protein